MTYYYDKDTADAIHAGVMSAEDAKFSRLEDYGLESDWFADWKKSINYGENPDEAMANFYLDSLALFRETGVLHYSEFDKWLALEIAAGRIVEVNE